MWPHPITSLSTTDINSKAIDIRHRKVSLKPSPNATIPSPRVCVPPCRVCGPQRLVESPCVSGCGDFSVIAETSASNTMLNPPRSRRLPPVAGLAVARTLLRSIWGSLPRLVSRGALSVSVLLSHPAGAPIPVLVDSGEFCTADGRQVSTDQLVWGGFPMIGGRVEHLGAMLSLL